MGEAAAKSVRVSRFRGTVACLGLITALASVGAFTGAGYAKANYPEPVVTPEILKPTEVTEDRDLSLASLLGENSRNERKYADVLQKLQVEDVLMPQRLGTPEGRELSDVALRHMKAATRAYYGACDLFTQRFVRYLKRNEGVGEVSVRQLQTDLKDSRKLALEWISSQEDVLAFAFKVRPSFDSSIGLLQFKGRESVEYARLLKRSKRIAFDHESRTAEAIQLRRQFLDLAVGVRTNEKAPPRER